MNRPNDSYDQWPVSAPASESRNNHWLVGILIGVVGVCLLAACLVGGYFFVWPALQQPEPVAAPAIPTLAGDPAAEPSSEGDDEVLDPEAEPEDPTAEATPTAGPTATSLPVGRQVTAVQVAAAPTLDGTLAEWPDSPVVASAFRVHAAAGWNGTDDLAALWRLAWDPQYLYIGVDVTDDAHVQTQSGQFVYQGDSLEIQVDTNPAANAARVNPSTYQLILSPGDFSSLAESAVRFRGTEGGRLELASGHAIRVEASPTAEGYTLEAAIPWQDLGVTPRQGLELGMALSANDNDSPGTAAQEVMMSHVSTRTLTDPRTWGRLVLD